MKEKSYGEIMKIAATKRTSQNKHFIQDLYIEMLLSEIQLNLAKGKLLLEIDSAIDQRDKELFLDLTTHLKELNKRFGT
ncbi:IDEAL domain-containing protein [Bacillus rubiinfantis]|uniref:IDEAL domain-containing protein n=1 Tax=Bacillus rubiinfantis TaxID=1499680 RepID=UPI0005A9F439|nr:IDEAL domain-containing protein [Bacillus rubiinfantis]